MDKVKETIDFLTATLKNYAHPVLYCSFGKDSCVLLHLLLSHNIRIPVIYHRDPFFPRKNAFADSVINLYNLEVWDYPPARVSLCHGKDMIALVNEYQSGPHSSVSVLKNALEFKDGDNPDEFGCGLSFLMRPCGIFNYPWNAALVAHKDCDEDQIFGVVPLKSRVVFRDEGPDYVFPLKDWTHDDVWDYTEQYKVPFQADRYNIALRKEWPDKTFNSDWYPFCLRCVDKRILGQTVFCPKLKKELVNVANAAPEWGHIPDYFSYSTERMYGHANSTDPGI
jgi:hypothetical protein